MAKKQPSGICPLKGVKQSNMVGLFRETIWFQDRENTAGQARQNAVHGLMGKEMTSRCVFLLPFTKLGKVQRGEAGRAKGLVSETSLRCLWHSQER